jgi:hypothetical protein
VHRDTAAETPSTPNPHSISTRTESHLTDKEIKPPNALMLAKAWSLDLCIQKAPISTAAQRPDPASRARRNWATCAAHEEGYGLTCRNCSITSPSQATTHTPAPRRATARAAPGTRHWTLSPDPSLAVTTADCQSLCVFLRCLTSVRRPLRLSGPAPAPLPVTRPVPGGESSHLGKRSAALRQPEVGPVPGSAQSTLPGRSRKPGGRL